MLDVIFLWANHHYGKLVRMVISIQIQAIAFPNVVREGMVMFSLIPDTKLTFQYARLVTLLALSVLAQAPINA